MTGLLQLTPKTRSSKHFLGRPWGRALERMLAAAGYGSDTAVAVVIGCSRQAVGAWKAGYYPAHAKHRRALLDLLGLPDEAALRGLVNAVNAPPRGAVGPTGHPVAPAAASPSGAIAPARPRGQNEPPEAPSAEELATDVADAVDALLGRLWAKNRGAVAWWLIDAATGANRQGVNDVTELLDLARRIRFLAEHGSDPASHPHLSPLE